MAQIWYILDKKVNYFSFLVFLLLGSFLFINHILYFSPSQCYGLGDCVKYSSMFDSYQENIFPAIIDYPFNLRILVPYIAKCFSNTFLLNINNSFFAINILSGYFVIIFVYLSMASLNLKNFHFMIFFLWFFLHPIGFSLYYAVPISIDPFIYALISIVIYCYVACRYISLIVICFIGLLAKESFLFIILMLMFTELLTICYENNKQKKVRMVFIFFLFIEIILYSYSKKYFLITLFPQSQPYEITSLGTIRYWLHEVVLDPKRIIVWVSSLLCSIGGISFMFINYIGKFPIILKDKVLLFLFLCSCGFMIFGLLAGSDMSRIIFNGIMFVFFLSFLLLNRNILLVLFFISFIATYLYTYWFPHPIEYEYYHTHSLVKYNIYLLIYSLTTLIIMLYIQKNIKFKHSL